MDSSSPLIPAGSDSSQVVSTYIDQKNAEISALLKRKRLVDQLRKVIFACALVFFGFAAFRFDMPIGGQPAFAVYAAAGVFCVVAATMTRTTRITIRIEDLENQLLVMQSLQEQMQKLASGRWLTLFNATIGPASSQYDNILVQRTRTMDMLFAWSLFTSLLLIFLGLGLAFWERTGESQKLMSLTSTVSGTLLQIFTGIFSPIFAKNSDVLGAAQLRVQSQHRFLLAALSLDDEITEPQMKVLQAALGEKEPPLGVTAAQ